MSEEKNESESIEQHKDKQDQQEQRSSILKEKMEMRHKQQIHFIMTQTNYDENEATEKLKTYNNDVMKVVSEYLGISPKEDEHINKTYDTRLSIKNNYGLSGYITVIYGKSGLINPLEPFNTTNYYTLLETYML